MNKPWATQEVSAAHKYDDVIDYHHLDQFVEFCNNIPFGAAQLHSNWPGIKILDLGCGNARVILALNNKLDSKQRYFYIGTDINEYALNAGRRVLKAREGSHFELLNFDVDNIPWEEPKVASTYRHNICLIDSTLHMFYNPIGVLNECDKYCDTIYITRNKLELQTGIYQGMFKWGGMTNDSPYWQFSKQFFDDFATKTNRDITYEIGPMPQTFNIIMVEK